MTDKRAAACINIRVPLRWDDIWPAIIAVADEATDTFTVEDVVANCGAPQPVVKAYVDRLTHAGFACKVTSRGSKLRLCQGRPAAAPCLWPDRQQLWNAMRALKAFTLDEVVFAAATEEVRIQRHVARNYVQQLLRAGYLSENAKRIGPAADIVYRLKPGANTGPLAPSLVSIAFSVVVLDTNTNAAPDVTDVRECRV